MSTTGDPAVTPRKQRAMDIVEREDVLRRVQSTAARRRAWVWQDEGRRVPVSAEEKAAGNELGALARERRELLAQVTERETVLRRRQGELDRDRAATAPRPRRSRVVPAAGQGGSGRDRGRAGGAPRAGCAG